MGLQGCKFAMGCLVKANPRIARAPREKLCSGAFSWDGQKVPPFQNGYGTVRRNVRF